MAKLGQLLSSLCFNQKKGLFLHSHIGHQNGLKSIPAVKSILDKLFVHTAWRFLQWTLDTVTLMDFSKTVTKLHFGGKFEFNSYLSYYTSILLLSTKSLKQK